MLLEALQLTGMDFGIGLVGAVAIACIVWIILTEGKGPAPRERLRYRDFDIAHGKHFRVIDKTRKGPEPHLGKTRVGL